MASYEWIQHAPIAQKAGVTDEQLSTIGDIHGLIEVSKKGVFSPLQQACLDLADEMTAHVKVRDETFDRLKTLLAQSKGQEAVDKEATEAVLTTATYNMVSRFLVAIDVGNRANVPCPVPGLPQDSGAKGIVSYPTTRFDYSHGLVQVAEKVQLATKVHFHSMQAPWIVFVNSLMTNLTMWDAVLPRFAAHFNIVTYDQRGHGASSVPPTECDLDQLTDDVTAILDALGVSRAHAVIGVSQGGATALNFALRHGSLRTARIVACDTQAVSPQANIAAWDERKAQARKEGMAALADVTVPRWFVEGQSKATGAVRSAVWQMITSTSVEGFARTARSLQGYDLVGSGLVDVVQGKKQPTAAASATFAAPMPMLLLAGSADGKLPEVLQDLAEQIGTPSTSFVNIDGAGHLPMCDRPQQFVDAVLPWLLQK